MLGLPIKLILGAIGVYGGYKLYKGFISPDLPADVRNPFVDPLKRKIFAFAVMNGIDPAYMLATIRQESNFDTMALRLEPDFFQRRVKENPTYEYEIINHSWNETNFGSYGLGQLLLSTAFDLGWRGVPMELYDPDTNIKYMGLLIKRNMSKLGIKTTPYNEKEIENLAAMYNSGQPLAKAPMITVSDYVPRIKKFYSQFAQEIQSGQA